MLYTRRATRTPVAPFRTRRTGLAGGCFILLAIFAMLCGWGGTKALADGNGFRGEYFNGILEQFRMARIDPVVDFNWGRGSPDPLVDPTVFSARWIGYVEPRYSEEYTFWTYSDDGVRLWVNGQQLINNWAGHGVTYDSGKITLVAGNRYSIRLEYFDHYLDAVIRLGWSSASQPAETIPQSRVYWSTDIYYVNDSVAGEAGSVCMAPGNDAADGLSPWAPMRHIQALLDKYPDLGTGKTVWLDPGTYAENVSIAATHAGLRIQGAGADKSVVDGGQANTVFVLNNFGAGELIGLTIQNGKATGATALEKSGGGIRVNGASTALIANCILKNNAAGSGSGGGGIYTYNASPVLRNLVVANNTGTGCGGIRTYGGAVTITNCTVANNVGGGIHKTGTGTLAITNSIAWANGDDLNGCAATYSCIEDGDAGTGNIAADPLFVNAAAGDYRLMVWSPCIDAANLASAPATDLAGNARHDDVSIPPDGSTYPDMGAYESQADSPSDTIYVNDGAFNEAGSVCTVAGNDANNGYSPSVPMRTIQGALNKYPAYGAGKTIWVDPGTFAENVNIVASHAGLKVQGAGAGKAIVDGQQLNSVLIATNFGAGEISGLTLQNGKATGATAIEKSGGGIRLYGASTALIANCIVKNNAAGTGSGGGGIYTYNASPTIRNVVVANNTGTGCGGIRTYGGAVTITNCTVANNVGGGIHKTGTGSLGITNSIAWANGDDLISCAATYSCIEDGDAGTGNVSADPMLVNAAGGDCHLKGGSSAIDAANGPVGPPTDLEGNSRRDDTGVANTGVGTPPMDMGAYEYQSNSIPSTLYVNDDSTAGDLFCSAVGDDANDGQSPATPMRHIQALLNKYPAIGPRTLKIDTGFYLETVAITAAHAGWKLQGAGAANSVIDGDQLNTVIALTAFGSGEISGLTIQNGKATGATALLKSGGGIRCYSGSNPLIANCILKNNAAGTSCGGGGIYTYTSSPAIRNCLVHHNTGTGNGGIRTYGGTVSIMNCTVANNTGGGIHRTGTGTLTITNTIAWENGDDLNACTATYSCIQDGDAGTGNISANPFFINPTGGDYHLDPASPCINTGTATGAPATDLDGTTRDATPDMGAYEYGS